MSIGSSLIDQLLAGNIITLRVDSAASLAVVKTSISRQKKQLLEQLSSMGMTLDPFEGKKITFAADGQNYPITFQITLSAKKTPGWEILSITKDKD